MESCVMMVSVREEHLVRFPLGLGYGDWEGGGRMMCACLGPFRIGSGVVGSERIGTFLMGDVGKVGCLA